ncbi:MAG: hypothetical protein M3Y87_16580 [Myxococcota bacterium]|nr:hypothetical protein [Myxococcota bacterium]
MRRDKNVRAALAVLGALVALGCDGEHAAPDADMGGLDAGPDEGMDGGTDRDSGDDRDDGGDRDDAGLPTAAPTMFREVARGGFTSPTDAVASPDGRTFYFAAFTLEGIAAIFTVPADGSAEATVRFEGAPLIYPSGLALSCDGATLYIADAVVDPEDDGKVGSILQMPVAGTTPPIPLGITTIAEPNAVSIGSDCEELIISGRTRAGEQTIFSSAIGPVDPTVVAMSGVLRAPTGLTAEESGTIYALDHLAEGENGRGSLLRIDASGTTTVASGLRLGTPGGITMTPGGGNVVIGSRRADGTAVLTVFNTSSMATTEVALPEAFVDPAGLRAARSAGVYAIVDSEGAAIYRGE